MDAYLDTNIIVDIENKVLNLADLIKVINPAISQIYYSASHVQEAKEIEGETDEIKLERIRKRLDTINRITNSNYLDQNLQDNKMYKLIEHPYTVWETVNEVPFADPAMKQFANLISQEQKNYIREMLGIDIIGLNNYRPEEVVQYFNKKLMGFGDGLSFLDLIERGISYHPQGKNFGLNNRIAGIFELLDLFGFWKDRYTEKSNFARLWDSSHAYFASFCDYFISNDKRTRNKTKVVYSIYGIKTVILSSANE